MIDDIKHETKCRIFICYRGSGGLDKPQGFKEYLRNAEDKHYGTVWFSDEQNMGNYQSDVMALLDSAEFMVIFFTEGFTKGFLTEDGRIDPQCITAMEIIEAERQRQQRPADRPLKLVGANIEGYTLSENDESVLKTLFLQQDLLRDDSLCKWRKLNNNKIYSRGTNYSEQKRIFFEQLANGLEINGDEYHFRFWRGSNRHLNTFKASHSVDTELLPQQIDIGKMSTRMNELVDSLVSGCLGNKRNLLITGEGGIGKSCHMINYWQHNMGDGYSQDRPVCLYLEANRFNNYEVTEKNILFKEIVEKVRYEVPQNIDIGNFFLNRVFTESLVNDMPKYIILIDGLDEIAVDSKKYKLLNEVVELLEHDQVTHSVSIVLTCRYNFMDQWVDKNRSRFLVGEMKPLNESIVQTYLSIKEGSISPQLMQLLANPFYLRMYHATILYEDGIEQLNSTFSSSNKYLKYRSTPVTPGELTWNYMMNQIEKEIRHYNTYEIDSVYNRYVILFLLLPYLAYEYVEQGGMDYDTFIECQESYLENLKKNKTKWKGFWNNSRPIESWKPETLNSDFIRQFVTRICPVLSVEEDKEELHFIHKIYLDYFYSLHLINLFHMVGLGLSPEKSQPIWKRIEPHYLKWVGEICGEMHNLPQVDKERKEWIRHIEHRNQLLERALDKLRGKFGDNEQRCVYNILEAIKMTRRTPGGHPDLAGLNLSGLDLRMCAIENIIFSRFFGVNYLCADFSRSLIDDKHFFATGHSTHVVSVLPLENETHLVSVDVRGDVLVWDLSINRPIDKLNLRDFLTDQHKSSYITNLTTGEDGTVYVACNDHILHLDLLPLKVRTEDTFYFPGISITRIGYNQRGLFYFTGDAPLTRHFVKEPPYVDELDCWAYDTVVSKDGMMGFRLDSYSFDSIDRLQKMVWSDGNWKSVQILLDENGFVQMFANRNKNMDAVIRISEDDKVLMLAANSGDIIEFDTETGSIIRKYRLSTNNRNNKMSDIRTMGEYKRVVSSYSHIHIIDLETGIQVELPGCYNDVSQCIFNFDTKTFIVTTKMSSTIQIFDRSNRCLGSFFIDKVMNINSAALAFNFSKDSMRFGEYGPLGLIGEYPERVRLLCLKKRQSGATFIEVDLICGCECDEFDKNTEIISSPKSSLGQNADEKFLLAWDKNIIKQILFSERYKRDESPVNQFINRPGWIIAQCDFTGVQGISETMRTALRQYTDKL